MKVNPVFAFLLFAPLLVAYPQNASQSSRFEGTVNTSGAPDEEILLINKEFVEAVEKSDTAVLSRIYADDYAGVGFTGQPTSKAEMAASNNTPFATLFYYVEDNIKIKVLGGTAIVTSRANMKTRLKEGNVISRSTAITRVWVKRQEKWQIVASQMNAMFPQAPQIDVERQTQGSAKTPWQNVSRVEQEALRAQINYLRQTTAAEAELRFAEGYFSNTITGMVTGKQEIVGRLKAQGSSPVNSSSTEVSTDEKRVLFRANDSLLVLDQFRSHSFGQTVSFGYRSTSYNKSGRVVGQSRIGGGTYKKRGALATNSRSVYTDHRRIFPLANLFVLHAQPRKRNFGSAGNGYISSTECRT